MESPLKKNDFEILESIRGIAALYVVIGHCRGLLWMGGAEFIKMFPRSGWNLWDYFVFGSSMFTRLAVEFVIVFFVLSGFSIAHSLSSNKSPGKFYLRRFVRIYPSYVAALIWAGLIFVVTRYWHPAWYDGSLNSFSFLRTMEMNNFFEPSVIVHNLFYMPGKGFIGPFWSLTYEVIFYLLAPFILRKPDIYIVISAGLFLFNLFFSPVIDRAGLHIYIHDFLFIYNIYFALGVFLYVWFIPVMNRLSVVPKRIFIIAICAALAVTYLLNWYFQIENTYSFLTAALLSYLLITFFLKYKIKINWLLFIGRFSYTLYITHVPSIFLFLAFYHELAKPEAPYIKSYFIWLPAVFVCLLFAYLQYLLVENKTKSILKTLRKKNA
jgi:peptidoglycan/LPS O-acetylase OafA/YrhL